MHRNLARSVPLWYPEPVLSEQASRERRLKIAYFTVILSWLRGLDLNQRPSGYEPVDAIFTRLGNSDTRKLSEDKKSIFYILLAG